MALDPEKLERHKDVIGPMAVIGLTLVILGFIFGIGGLLWMAVDPAWGPFRFTIACAAMMVIGLFLCAVIARMGKK